MPTEDELEQRLLENLGLLNNEEQNETKTNKTKKNDVDGGGSK